MYYQLVAVTKTEDEPLYAEFLIEAESALDAIIKFNGEDKEIETKVVSVSPTNISKVL